MDADSYEDQEHGQFDVEEGDELHGDRAAGPKEENGNQLGSQAYAPVSYEGEERQSHQSVVYQDHEQPWGGVEEEKG